ncbi:MAG TPA: hypothetical protein VLA89_16465 [Gemmatimonadales bacterium]|nr:hypothetical protein [Gemmatimonadales bacterium]
MIVQGPDGVRIDFGDATPDQIKAAMRKRYGDPSVTSAQVPRMPPMVGSGSPIGDLATRFAPAIAGAGGGVLFGIPGAAVGGGIGEVARQAGMGEPINPSRAVTEGGKQAAFQGIGTAVGALGIGAGPIAGRLAGWMNRPLVRKGMKMLPIGGALSHGIPGAVAGAAIPIAGRAALRFATSPRTAAFLSSPAFQEFARQSPRAAVELYQQMVLTEQPDATR